jgi:hypothetical protein
VQLTRIKNNRHLWNFAVYRNIFYRSNNKSIVIYIIARKIMSLKWYYWITLVVVILWVPNKLLFVEKNIYLHRIYRIKLCNTLICVTRLIRYTAGCGPYRSSAIGGNNSDTENKSFLCCSIYACSMLTTMLLCT